MKKVYVQNYRFLWEKDPAFASWLIKDPESNNRAYCKICKISFQSKKSVLIKHATKNILHKQRLELIVNKNSTERHINKECENINPLKQQSNNEITEIQILQNEVTINEDIVMSSDTNYDAFQLQVQEEKNTVHYNSKNSCTYEDKYEFISECGAFKYVHKYRPEWQIKFQEWLRPVPNDLTKVHCILCNKSLVANISVLNAHNKIHSKDRNKSNIFDGYDFQKAMTEIKISAMLVDRCLSFLLIDHLMPFLQVLAFDSTILKNVCLNRIKATKIVANVIAPVHKLRLSKILKNTTFSIMIDESTDICSEQCLCIVVRYFDEDKGCIRDSLWDLVPIFDGDENRKGDNITLCNKVISTFAEADIKLSNIIAFCSDTCNLMMGNSNSVSEKLQKLIPGVQIIKCGCHIEHLCGRDAIRQLPVIYEQIPNLIYNYISSPKRCNKWEVLQIKSEVKVLQILRPVATRWLSYFLSMLRIYRRWTVLERFFKEECIENNTLNDQNAAEKILLDYFTSAINKVYHSFVISSYLKLYIVNKKLQSEKPLVPISIDLLKQIYLEFLCMYMRKSYVKNTRLADINPSDETRWKSIQEIKFDADVEQKLKTVIHEDEITYFKENSRNLCAEICKKLKIRCDFNGEIFIHLQCFYPKNALNEEFHVKYKNLDDILIYFQSLTNFHDGSLMISINEEWKELLLYNFPEEITREKNADIFWLKIRSCVNEEEMYLFPNLSKFALAILCLPNSNASPERVWSAYNREKTKCRAALKLGTTRGILLTLQYIHDIGGLLSFEPTYDMYIRMKNNINDNFQISRKISSMKHYKGTRITKEYIKTCQEEENSCFEIKKDLKNDNVNKYFEMLSNTNDDYDERYAHDSENDEEYVDFLIKDVSTFEDTDKIIFNNIGIDEESNELLINGLMKNYRHYFKNLIYFGNNNKEYSKIYTVGKYYRNTDIVPLQYTKLLFSTEYQTLAPQTYIDGDVIDACSIIYERTWKNSIFISTGDTYIFFKDDWDVIPNDDWILFKIQFPDSGKIFFPYVYNQHWRLFMLDVTEKIATLIDPLNVTQECLRFEGLRVFRHFIRYLNICEKRGYKNIPFNSKGWRLVWFISDRPYQHDGYNCGIYVIYYMNIIANDSLFDKSFDPDMHRWVLSEMLIRKSEDMRGVCQFCFRNWNVNIVSCRRCKRISHDICLRDKALENNDICELCAIK